MVYDELFTTVPNALTGVETEEFSRAMWDRLLETGEEYYFERGEVDHDDNPIEPPPLNDEWLEPEERQTSGRR